MRLIHANKIMKSWLLALLFCLAAMLPVAEASVAAAPVTAVQFASQQEAFAYYLDLAEKLEVSTGIGKSVFYSGPGNRKMAEKFALSEDKTTLEMTTGGKYLDDLRLFETDSPLTPEMATKVWSILSRRYAAQAAGDVFCFVAGARPTGVFTTVELPELKRNRKVVVIYSVAGL